MASMLSPAVRSRRIGRDPDLECVVRCRHGDREAFAAIVRKYQRRVLTLAARLLNNHTEAEDLAQDVFVKVFQALPDFRGTARFSTWLYRITVNQCLNDLRRRARQQQTLAATEPQAWVQASPPTNPQRVLEQKERWALVQSALQALSPEQRTIIVLRDMEGLSYDELAEVLQLEQGTVKSRLHRARMELKTVLEPYVLREDAGHGGANSPDAPAGPSA